MKIHSGNTDCMLGLDRAADGGRQPRLLFATVAAISALACLPAHAQSSAEIFGVLSTGIVHITNTNGPSYKVQSGLNSSTYWGFRGREDLGGGLAAVFSLASAVAIDTGVAGSGGSFWSKNAYVGLSDDGLGAVLLGRNDEFVGDICQTDVMCARSLVMGLHPGNLDRIGAGNLSNMVKYISPPWKSFRAKTYYAFPDRTLGANGRASGADVTYTTDTLSAVGSFESINNVSISPLNQAAGFGVTRLFNTPVIPTTAFALDRLTIAVLSARYLLGNWTYYATAVRVGMVYKGLDQPIKTFDLGAGYNFTPLTALSLGLSHSELNSGHWNTGALHLTYLFSKRTTAYASDVYQRSGGSSTVPQLLQAGGFSPTHSQNIFGVGVRHNF